MGCSDCSAAICPAQCFVGDAAKSTPERRIVPNSFQYSYIGCGSHALSSPLRQSFHILTYTAPRPAPRQSVATWALVLHPFHFQRAFVRLMKSDVLRKASPPACCLHCYCCCRRIERRFHASSLVLVLALARHSIPHLRIPPLVPGLRFRYDVLAAWTSEVWLVSGVHRENV